MAVVLIVPGLHGSGPDHWQTWWQAEDTAAARVEQDDWHAPDLERWSARVREVLDRVVEPAWLVAHSFGCLACVHASAERPERVAGALLVAPANPDRFGVRSALPDRPLPYPSLLVSSLNDPWLPSFDALEWADRWGSHLVDLGEAGHINAEAGYGPWPQGRALFRELQERGKPRDRSTPGAGPSGAAAINFQKIRC